MRLGGIKRAVMSVACIALMGINVLNIMWM